MSEQHNEITQPGQTAETAELSEQELDQASGGLIGLLSPNAKSTDSKTDPDSLLPAV